MKKPLALLSVLAFVFAISAMGVSASTSTTTTSNGIVVKNYNHADIMNSVRSKANTGFNKVFKAPSIAGVGVKELNGTNGTAGSSFIGSGGASATSTSGTTANNSGINVAAPNMGGLGLGATTPSGISITNENRACIENRVSSRANSGGNYINASSGGDATISSGSAVADSLSSTDVNTSTISVSQ